MANCALVERTSLQLCGEHVPFVREWLASDRRISFDLAGIDRLAIELAEEFGYKYFRTPAGLVFVKCQCLP